MLFNRNLLSLIVCQLIMLSMHARAVRAQDTQSLSATELRKRVARNEWSDAIFLGGKLLQEPVTAQQSKDSRAQITFLVGRSCLNRAVLDMLLQQLYLATYPRYLEIIQQTSGNQSIKKRALFTAALVEVYKGELDTAAAIFLDLNRGNNAELISREVQSWQTLISILQKSSPKKNTQVFSIEYMHQLYTALMNDMSILKVEQNNAGLISTQILEKSNKCMNLKSYSEPWRCDFDSQSAVMWSEAETDSYKLYDPAFLLIMSRFFLESAICLLDQSMINSDQSTNSSLFLKAQTFFFMGDFQQALQALERVTDEYKDKAGLKVALSLKAGSVTQINDLMKTITRMTPDEQARIIYWLAYAGLDAFKYLFDGKLPETSRELSVTGNALWGIGAVLSGYSKYAEQFLNSAQNPQNRDETIQNQHERLVTSLLVDSLEQKAVTPQMLESLFTLQKQFPEARMLYDILQGLYGSTIKKGGQNALDSGS